MKKLILLITICIVAFSCNTDDSNPRIIESTPELLETIDFSATLQENPAPNQTIGFIEVTSNSQSLTYTITQQSNLGALNLNTTTGELTVADALQFDFEANEQITATVVIADGVDEVESTITINLQDVFYENDLILRRINHLTSLCQGVSSDNRVIILFDNYQMMRGVQYNGFFYGFTFEIAAHNGAHITQFRANFGSGGGSLAETFNLNYGPGDLIIDMEHIITDDSGITTTRNYDFQHLANKITMVETSSGNSIHMYTNNNGSVSRYENIDGVMDFVYDANDNLLSKLSSDGASIEYTYDTKRNPFPTLTPLNWGAVMNIYNALCFNESWFFVDRNKRNDGVWFSKNNILDVSWSGSHIVNYTYSYNSDGFPVIKQSSCENNMHSYFYQ